MVRLTFRTRADFAAPSSRELVRAFAEKSYHVAKGPAMAKANLAASVMRAELQSAPKSNNWQVKDAQRVSSYIVVLPVKRYERLKVAPGTPIPVALVGSNSLSTWRWQHGDSGVPATYFITKAIKSAGR